MRLILFDTATDQRCCFDPMALSRPLWELRCGMSSLGEKLIAKLGAADVAFFAPHYLADVYRNRTGRMVNDIAALAGDDLLLVNARVKAEDFAFDHAGPSQVWDDGDEQVLAAWIRQEDLSTLETASLEDVLASAMKQFRPISSNVKTWDYIWDLVLANPDQITKDFSAAGRSGIEGTVEQPNAIRGSKNDIYIAKGSRVHPMVVIDAEHGPVYIDEGAEIHPFSRIEGPCYIGKKSVLLGAKCREGNSIGPVCRVGGEIEESIIHGHSNKYHDGFLGHAYIGEWVNLGALTTNSDLKNDYSSVEVFLAGKKYSTNSTKVGCFIGDHTKTSIGTLFNSGTVVGVMTLLMSTGTVLPKSIPSFAWFLRGVVTKGFGRRKLYETAKTAMSRRGQAFDDVQLAMYEHIFKLTRPQRDEAIKKGRREITRRSGPIGAS